MSGKGIKLSDIQFCKRAKIKNKNDKIIICQTSKIITKSYMIFTHYFFTKLYKLVLVNDKIENSVLQSMDWNDIRVC